MRVCAIRQLALPGASVLVQERQLVNFLYHTTDVTDTVLLVLVAAL